jgi:hypothetical protein
MKNDRANLRSLSAAVLKRFTLLLILAALSTHRLCAQAPGLLWTTNVGGNVFAVDGQTNVYANANGTVITLNANGQPFATNLICPVPSVLAGFAAMDSGGNFYFAGSFDGTNDFGGTTLVGGWINDFNFHPPKWVAGYPTCYIAKYAGNGALLWVVGFGQQAEPNYFTDMILNSDDSVTVAFVAVGNAEYSASLAKYASNGTNVWEETVPSSMFFVTPVRLSGIVGTNGGLLSYRNANGIYPEFYNASGTLSGTGGSVPGSIPVFTSQLSTNGKPVTTVANELYLAGLDNMSYQPILQKYLLGGGLAWSQPIGTIEQWLLGSDNSGYLYLAGTSGVFSQYDLNGNQIWTTNYGPPAVSVLVDASNNRILQLDDGSIARVAADLPPVLPVITTPPQSATVFVGDNVTFNETASGSRPLYYQWQLDGTNVPNATGAVLNLNSVTTSQAGSYTVVVSNSVGPVTSTPPAVLRVKQVELYAGSQLLTNGTYTFNTTPTLTIRSAFTNGEEYYTLDGSAPDFTATFYSGPFTLSQSATVRAIGYSDDFSQSEDADDVNIIVLVSHTLAASSSGGGNVTLNPPGGTYLSTNTVTVSAVPNSGWQFLYWLGDAAGSNSTFQFSMNSDKSVTAVFGTTLSTTVAGNGQVTLDPSGGLYAYGTTVRLTGVPQAGSFFGAWGNAGSGNINPLYFTVTNPTPTVSSIFGTTSASQAALTVEISGHGRVNVSPQGNVFSTNQMVTLTAVPDPGQTFLGWGGDASGSQTSLGVTMNQSKVITASFSSALSLRVSKQFGEGISQDGFRFAVVGDPNSIYHVFSSSNMTSWESLGYVTNQFGTVQLLDSVATNSTGKYYRIAP